MSTPNSEANQIELVPHTYQGALIQQRAKDGYINATAMCKAAGKQFHDYTRLASTTDFLGALGGSTGIPVNRLVMTVVTGANEVRGSYVHPQVAIHLAQWLSAEFAVKVSEWIVEWMSGAKPSDRVWQQFEDRVSLVYDNVPEGYFCVFREIADLFASLINNGANPGTRMILDISVGLCWGRHWTSANLGAQFGPRATFSHYYPSYFPQAMSNPQPAKCYPEEALPAFRRWMREVYIPYKMPEYLRSQVQQNKLPSAIANNALAALAARQAARALPRP